jgi:seryl-tRNA synthetase
MISERIKSVTQAVMAITALLTAVTSLVKAYDKRLEQTSYEALANTIQEMQKDQAALQKEFTTLQNSREPIMRVIENTADSGVPQSDSGLDKLNISAKQPPVVKLAPPKPSSSAVLSRPPLPKWSDIKEKANKL